VSGNQTTSIGRVASTERKTMSDKRIHVGGPYFDDLSHGQVFDGAPSITLTDGLAASHQAILGDGSGCRSTRSWHVRLPAAELPRIRVSCPISRSGSRRWSPTM